MATLRSVFSTGLPALLRTQPAARTLLKQGTWKAAKQSRPFSSSIILHSRPWRGPSQIPANPYNQQSRSYEDHESFKGPFGSDSSSLIVGSVIAGCIGIFVFHSMLVLEVAKGSEKASIALQRFGDNFRLSVKNFREGRYWVLLTHSFLHENAAHLLVNMVALWGFGRSIAMLYGLKHFAALWVGSALVGGQMQLWYFSSLEQKGIPSPREACGASGAIFGLVSALSLVAPRLSVSFMFFIPMSLRTAMLLSVAGSVAALENGWLPWLGHVDHLGGMSFGLLWWITMVLRRR